MNGSRTVLATLAADPERVANVALESVPTLLGELEALKARLWARLYPASPRTAGISSDGLQNGGPDRLLTAAEAAERLGVNRRWIYRYAATLPFTRRLSKGTMRFSERGLMAWKETRRRR